MWAPLRYSHFSCSSKKGLQQLEDASLNVTAGQILPGHFQHHSCASISAVRGRQQLSRLYIFPWVPQPRRDCQQINLDNLKLLVPSEEEWASGHGLVGLATDTAREREEIAYMPPSNPNSSAQWQKSGLKSLPCVPQWHALFFIQTCLIFVQLEKHSNMCNKKLLILAELSDVVLALGLAAMALALKYTMAMILSSYDCRES